MSSHIVHKPNIRLEQKATRGKGVGLHEAVKAATARMEHLRTDALARIAEILAGLAELREAIAIESTVLAADRTRSLADELAGLCGPFGLTELGAVAAKLCRLADADEMSGTRLAAVKVTLDIVHLFANADPSAHADLARSVLPQIERLAHNVSTGVQAD